MHQTCHSRSFGIAIAALAAVVMLAAALPANALVPPPGIKSKSIGEHVARKGTRNYRSDGSTAPVPANTVDKVDSMKLCMDTWDAATHITRSKWREICQRQLKDRDSMRTP
jgi:hypothetical protein